MGLVDRQTNELPALNSSEAMWRGALLQRDIPRWTWVLGDSHTATLKAAARIALSRCSKPEEITEADFPPGDFQTVIDNLRKELLTGLGFAVIRLAAHDLSQQELEAIFMGIGIHLGNPRPQNAQGDLLGHVRDLGKSSQDPNVRIYQTNERQHFHTDSADVVGLLCVRPALEGGDSLLVSAERVYHEMRSQRPDLLKLLMEPMATDRRGEVPPGLKPFTLIPIFSHYQDQLTVYYQRQYIESAQRFEEAPRLTPQHHEALDLFDSLCNDPQLHLSMRLEAGDMQFVYNHNMLHDRTAFRDHADPTRRRYLRRLWLAIPGDRELPPVFAERYGDLTPGSRGGIYIH